MIPCDQHDYIEIVCLYHYPIKLTMKDGSIHQCVARDTTLNDDRQECIKVARHGDERLIVLDDIARMDVCMDNPHVKTVTFT